MTKLEKLREEGAIELMNAIVRLEPWQEPPDFDKCFKNGWDQCDAHYRPIVESLLKEVDQGLIELYRYLNWNADDLVGDDLIGDKRKTKSFEAKLKLIEGPQAALESVRSRL